MFYLIIAQKYTLVSLWTLLLILQNMEWYAMLNLIRYQDTRSLGEITYETLNQPEDLEMRKKTFRAREKRLNKLFKMLLLMYFVFALISS